MVSSVAATPKPLAEPPYVELSYDTGSPTTQAVAASITRNGEPVRIPGAVPVPGQTVTWKDYDAPFDDNLVYVFSLSTRQAPTGGTSEDWSGTLTSKGWTSVTLTQSSSVMMRTNLITTPSFEGASVGGWSAYASNNSISTSTTQAKYGTRSMSVTAVPVTATNFVTDPFIAGSDPGWGTGSGSASYTYGSGIIDANGASGSAGRAYLNSPEYSVTAGTTYWIGITLYRDAPAGSTGATGFLYRWYNSSHAQVGADAETVVTISAGTTRAYSVAAAAPATATYLRIFPFTTKSFVNNPPIVGYFGGFNASNIFVTDANTGVFSGATTDNPTYQYDWTGTPNASTSTRKTVVTHTGASATVTGLTGGATYTLSYYYYGTSGGTAEPYIQAQFASTSSTSSAGATETTSWQRMSHTFTMPAAETSVILRVFFDNFAFATTRYVDGFLLEAGSVTREYFDGTTSAITATSLGTWAVAWTGSTEASTSEARFSTVVNNGSAIRTFTIASSGIDFLGFRTNGNLQIAAYTLTLTGGTLTYTVTQNGSAQTHQLSFGASLASMVIQGPFSGPMSLAFINDRASLTQTDSGATIDVPMTNSVLSTVRIDTTSSAYSMPFTIQPGVVLSTDTGTSSVVALSPEGAWLYHPYTPSLSIEIDAGQGCDGVFATFESAREMIRKTITSLLSPIGSRRMIAVSLGDRKDPSWDLELSSKTAEQYDAIVDLFQDAAPLRFDYPLSLDDSDLCNTGMRVPKGWFSPGDISEQRDTANWASPLRRWQMPMSPVSVPSAYPVE